MIDFVLVDKAICMAKEAHKDIKRINQEPYINHLHRVAGRVAPLFPTTDALVLAYLHDIVEDTPTTIRDIEAVFGMGIARGVFVLTQGIGEPRHIYLARAMADEPTIVAVKYADRCDNMQGLDQLGIVDFANAAKHTEHVKRYVDEVERFFLPHQDAVPATLALELLRTTYDAKRLFGIGSL